ncbi:hypothetical protein STEG23_016914 [Scotinomys teguina]
MAEENISKLSSPGLASCPGPGPPEPTFTSEDEPGKSMINQLHTIIGGTKNLTFPVDYTDATSEQVSLMVECLDTKFIQGFDAKFNNLDPQKKPTRPSDLSLVVATFG